MQREGPGTGVFEYDPDEDFWAWSRLVGNYWEREVHFYRSPFGVPGDMLWLAEDRIDRTVKRVWVCRLSEMSNADVVAEGIEGYENDSHGMRSEIVGQFMAKWDAIYAKRGLGWDANPWVWACEWEER